MKKKDFKGRCRKKKLAKCKDVCRTYDDIQFVYADLLNKKEDILEIRCNVPLEGLSEGEYTTDFVCIKTDKDLMVRECVPRSHLMKPLTVQRLDLSREYWQKRGVTDWGLVTNAKK